MNSFITKLKATIWATKPIHKALIAGAITTGYTAARMGVFGTNNIVLKDSRTVRFEDALASEENYIGVKRNSCLLFDRLSYWVDGRIPCYEITKYSIRPIRVEHIKLP